MTNLPTLKILIWQEYNVLTLVLLYFQVIICFHVYVDASLNTPMELLETLIVYVYISII